jgi:hypothetical protein
MTAADKPAAAAVPPPTDSQLMLAEMKRANAALERLALTLEKMAQYQKSTEAPTPPIIAKAS